MQNSMRRSLCLKPEVIYMYDTTDDISKMSFKELKIEIQRLRDELQRMQRSYEDILYNLDNDNLGYQLKKEKDGMKTAIEQTEEEIKLRAEEISENRESISALSVTANGLTSMAKKNISAYFESSIHPDRISASVGEKAMLCLYDGVYYYYNEFEERWLEYPADGLQTFFEQTADGFKLNGSVKVTGVAKVDKNLYIGDADDNTSRKYIYFNGGANIHTNKDHTGNPPTGIVISASSLDLTGISYIYWGESNKPTAVFA